MRMVLVLSRQRSLGLEPPQDSPEAATPKVYVKPGSVLGASSRVKSELDGPLSEVAGPTGARLAAIAAKLGDRQLLYRSIELLEQAVDRKPDDLQAATQLADAYVATGRELALVQAIQMYRSQLADSPDGGPLLSRIADAYHQLGNIDDALIYATRRAQLPAAPNRYAGALQLALICIEAGEPARGLEVAERIHREHPNDHTVALLVATLMFESKRGTAAKNLLIDLINRLPEDHMTTIRARGMLKRRQ